MSDEIENMDEVNIDIEPVELTAYPHSWIAVFAGCTAFGFVITAAALSILQYVASRPYDLVNLSEQTARSIESFLTNHSVPAQFVSASEPVLFKDPDAHYYRHDYMVRLPKNLNSESLERLLSQKLARTDLIVSDLVVGGIKQGMAISFGDFTFANVRIVASSEPENYSALNTDRATLNNSASSRSSLPTISLPKVNRAAFPNATRALDARVTAKESTATATGPASAITPAKKTYSGWVPASSKASTPDPPTRAADDIELARIPTPDPQKPVVEPPKPEIASVPRATVKLAIIVDDGGYGGALTDTILELDSNLTLSILPNTPLGTKIAESAHEKGFEIMLHMPMENSDADMLHPGQLNTTMTEAEIARWTNDALKQVPHAIGVNNHTGSKFTTDAKAMALFMESIKDLDLYFIDSKTTPDTRAYAVSKTFDIPSAERDLFLDHVNTEKEIRRRFKEVVAIAKENGQAIAICHFRPNTAAVLGELLATLESEGVTLVHASELIQ